MTLCVTGKNGSEIKAETIHVHFTNPITKAVEDHATHNGIVAIEGITATGEIRMIIYLSLYYNTLPKRWLELVLVALT